MFSGQRNRRRAPPEPGVAVEENAPNGARSTTVTCSVGASRLQKSAMLTPTAPAPTITTSFTFFLLFIEYRPLGKARFFRRARNRVGLDQWFGIRRVRSAPQYRGQRQANASSRAPKSRRRYKDLQGASSTRRSPDFRLGRSVHISPTTCGGILPLRGVENDAQQRAKLPLRNSRDQRR